MNKSAKIFIKIIIFLLYIFFVIDFLLPPYNSVIESYILNVPIVVYFEILAYLLCGILLGSIIGEFIPNETVFNRNIIIFILIMLGLVAFLKPIYFWSKGIIPAWILGKEMYFNILFGVLLGSIICLKMNRHNKFNNDDRKI